jgi:hypothetical protein
MTGSQAETLGGTMVVLVYVLDIFNLPGQVSKGIN